MIWRCKVASTLETVGFTAFDAKIAMYLFITFSLHPNIYQVEVILIQYV